MTEQYLSVNGGELAETDKEKQMIKTYSFTSDDDDASSVVRCQRVTNYGKLLSVNSPSIDNASNEDDKSDTSSKLKKRKLRRHTDSEQHIEPKQPSKKKPSWYKKIDWSRPLTLVFTIIFLYLMWIKRDIWIPRLLTSNVRPHRPAHVENGLTAKEMTISSTTPSEYLFSSSIDEDDLDENNDQEIETNDDTITSPIKSNNAQKINIRTRRNKMNFAQERPKNKKNRRVPDPSIDNDNVDNSDTDEDKEDKSNLILKNFPSEKHQSVVSKETFKTNSSSNYNVILSTHKDIVEQLRKNLKSRSRDRNFLSTISKTTGLSRKRLHRFIHKNTYRSLTLRNFISLIDSFNLMLLVVPKDV